MRVKKVLVNTISTRDFVDSLLYLGSIGGVLTDKCAAYKGMFLRAEVEVDETTPIKESPILKVLAGEATKREIVESEAPVAKKTATKRVTKTAAKVKEDE